MADDFENRLAEAMRERDRASVDERTASTIDAALRTSFQDRGVQLGTQWEKPASLVRAYPKRWLTFHDGHYWVSTCSVATEEPGTESTEWDRSDPDTTSEDGDDR